MSVAVVPAALVPSLLHGLSEDDETRLSIDGTAVLVDISGFTSLSEQLTAAGREGTEQLIATLSRIFSVLLPSTDDGGDIVKFAGDALLVLFSGEDHARHAAHAAWNMNRVLAAIGDIHLPSARTRLRMSVGVHTGTFELFLSGTDTVNVVLTGEATWRVLELQDAAPAGGILVSRETAALLTPKQVAPVPDASGGHRLLRAGSVVVSSLMALSSGRGSASARFLPRAFVERPDLLGSAPDHRWVAVGFIKVSGVPDRPDAADVARIDRLTRLVDEVVAETGSTLLDVDPAVGGFRYVLTAGAPTTVEDPEGRLVTAAVRVVTSDACPGWVLQAGVSSGRVFAGFVGTPHRQTYTVMGDNVNIAARLTARAEPGTVLATRDTLERSATRFECEDGGTIKVKGKRAGIPVVVVSAPGHRDLAAPDHADDGRAPFVGRRAELARLREALRAAEGGSGRVLTLVGPAGVGKSRLLARALAGVGLPVLRADGDRFGSTTPYRTLRSLLRQLLRIPEEADRTEAGRLLVAALAELRTELVPWAPLLAPAVGAEVPDSAASAALDDSFRVQRLHTVLGELLEAAAPGPGCLVVDDGQWVDPASAAALEAVLPGQDRYVVLVVRRAGEGGLTLPGETTELRGLPDEDAADLVEAVLGRPLLPADLTPILRRAGGSPLYLLELATAFTAGGEAVGIEHLVGERIDALSTADRDTLRRAAVLGARVPLALYVRLVGPPLVAGALGAFLQLGVDAVSFRSELFRDVAYAQLNYQSRRELHRAAAAVLEGEPALAGGSADAMLMAHHQAAGDWPAACAAALRAAAEAERTFAVDDAVRAYRVAVDAARRSRSADLPEILESLARVSVAGGRTEEALDALAAARKLAHDVVTRARLDQQQGHALNLLGHPDEALRVLRTARRAAKSAGDHALTVLAAVAVTEAGVRLRQADWAQARALAAEAVALLARSPEVDRRLLADAYRYHDIAATELEGDAGMLHVQDAVDLYDQLGDELSKSKVLSLLGVRAYYRGDWTTAATLYDQARQAAEAAGDVVGAAIESANAAEILVDQGRVDEARPLVKAALRVFAGSDNPYLVAFVTGFLGRAELRAGSPGAAREAFADAADRFTALGEADSLADVQVRRLGAHLEAGQLAEARAAADALSTGDGLPAPTRSQLTRHLARIAGLGGDPGRAADLARAAADVAGATPLDRALAQVELSAWSPVEAPTLLQEARTLLTALGVVDVQRLLSPPAPRPEEAESHR